DEQKGHLSSLKPGRVIIMHPGLEKAIQMQVPQTEINDTKRVPPDDEMIRKKSFDYYWDNRKTGTIPALSYFKKQPSMKEMELLLELADENNDLYAGYKKIIMNKEKVSGYDKTLKKAIDEVGKEVVAQLIVSYCQKEGGESVFKELVTSIEYILSVENDYDVDRIDQKDVLRNH
ncbi:MAG: hypothetical protein J5819_09220, partial [Eubacterium sp.]|nr:hypothetical protein [Eubacterium sp.]